ncbi:MAG TPA: NfeD family protein [Geminicoccaceae bacterium]|nr:NfeD family protein [Geminicoccaceae bacterium]
MIPGLGPVEYWHWWALGGALLIVEAFVPGFVFLWLGIAAGLVGSLVWLWPGIGPDLQVLIFAGLSVASVVGWRRWRNAHPPSSDQPHLNRRGAQYLGRQFALVEPITNGRGRIKLGDSSWAVTGPDLPAGATVEVVGADGTVLEVRPVAVAGRAPTDPRTPGPVDDGRSPGPPRPSGEPGIPAPAAREREAPSGQA